MPLGAIAWADTLAMRAKPDPPKTSVQTAACGVMPARACWWGIQHDARDGARGRRCLCAAGPLAPRGDDVCGSALAPEALLDHL